MQVISFFAAVIIRCILVLFRLHPLEGPALPECMLGWAVFIVTVKAAGLVQNVIAESFLSQDPFLLLPSALSPSVDCCDQICSTDAITSFQLSALAPAVSSILVILPPLSSRLSTRFSSSDFVILFSIGVPVGYVHQLVHGGKFCSA